MNIVVDTNIIISALIKDSKTREILADKKIMKKIKSAENEYRQGKTVSFAGIVQLRKHLGL